MARIGFIAPMEPLRGQALTAVKELGWEEDVEIGFATFRSAVAIARDMAARGVAVLVTRGGIAEEIVNAGVGVPVVFVPMSCQELSQAVYDAKALTGLERPRITMVLMHTMNQDLDLFAKVLGADLRIIYVEGSRKGIAATVAAIDRNEVDVLIGGAYCTTLAKKKHFQTILLPSSPASIKVALLEAMNIVNAIDQEQARTARFKTLVNTLREGVVYVDADGRVSIMNPAAEEMLGCTAADLGGKHIRSVLPIQGIEKCLAGDGAMVEDVITIGGSTLIAAVTPAPVGRNLSGAVVSLQETDRIARMDVKIRQKVRVAGLTAAYRFGDIVGKSAAIVQAKRLAAEYAATESVVLIFGETGTGKELFAQSIHNASVNANGPFVVVNCAALPPSLLESELFGYEKGAFTGANSQGRTGLLELAHNGTLFLDEISELDNYGQLRLLRFLQEKQVMRLGGDKYIPVTVRVIAATNRNLKRMVEAGTFRSDLFYRLQVLPLYIPPLREREDDVLHIADGILAGLRENRGKRASLSPPAKAEFRQYSWPGNVRELANVLESLAIDGGRHPVSGSVAKRLLYRSEDLFARLDTAPGGGVPNAVSAETDGGQRFDAVEEAEAARFLHALEAAGGNFGQAAAALGLHRSTLYRKLKRIAGKA